MPALTTIQLRRGTSAEWASSLNALAQGEMGFDTTIKKFKIGNGSTLWSGLPWANLMGADFVGVSGVNVSYSSPSGTVTVSVTGLNANYISDFASSVSGLLPVKSLVAGTNIAITPTGDKGFVISTNGLDTNAVKDVVGSTIIGVSGIRASYDNASKVETISVTGLNSSYISDFNSSVSGLLNVKSLVQGSGIGIVNNAGAQTISVTGIPSSLITDLGNIATTQVVGRTGIALTYNAITDTMYIDTTGVSLVGHTHTWSNITDASTKATLTELGYLSGVSPGTASASRALVVDSSKNLTGINNLTTVSDVIVGGNLTVQGTTTTVNSTTINIGDNIIRVNTSGLSTGGMEVYTGTDTKQLVWNTTSSRWEFIGGNVYTSGNFVGNLTGNASTVTNGVYTTDTGTVTSTMIANDTIVNTDINSAAAIAYSKLNLSGSIVNSDINASAAIADSKLATISTSGKVSNSATTATNANTASAIVARDASGNFSAGTITANLAGNASTVTNGVYTTDTGTVTSAMIADNTIVNADINSSAAIAYSKLNLSSGILNSDISNSAAIAYSKLNLGSSVTNSDIATNASISYSKLNLASGITNNDISATGAIAYSKLNLATSIVNTDISALASIAYSKLNLSSSIMNADIAENAAIAVSKLASSGVTIGNTTINLGATTTTLAGLTSISGVSAANPTTLYYFVIDGGTP